MSMLALFCLMLVATVLGSFAYAWLDDLIHGPWPCCCYDEDCDDETCGCDGDGCEDEDFDEDELEDEEADDGVIRINVDCEVPLEKLDAILALIRDEASEVDELKTRNAAFGPKLDPVGEVRHEK